MIRIALVIYALMSVVTFAVYGYDKRAARLGRWRVRESTLQGLALFGGWPGALLGQGIFRHKRRKRGFMALFGFICALHVAVWAWIMFRNP